jgi:hypothetical protein
MSKTKKATTTYKWIGAKYDDIRATGNNNTNSRSKIRYNKAIR